MVMICKLSISLLLIFFHPYDIVCSSWVTDMAAILLADELPQDVAGAEAVLANHIEHKGEIDARQASFVAFKSTGEELITANHYASDDVRM